jgi:hypothetical protein
LTFVRIGRALGAITLVGVAALLLWDFSPGLFPAHAHDILGAFPLALIAVAWLVFKAADRRSELVKSILLAAAFLFWAANQLWPGARQATLFNDVAIALFVLDLFLMMRSRPEA